MDHKGDAFAVMRHIDEQSKPQLCSAMDKSAKASAEFCRKNKDVDVPLPVLMFAHDLRETLGVPRLVSISKIITS